MRTMATDSMTVKINANDNANLVGKLADAELHFTVGPLEGSQARWIRDLGAARQCRPQGDVPRPSVSVNGDKRTFTLLRPVADTAANERIRDLVLEAYAEYQ